MSHSIGIGDSYYRASETELLDDYSKAIEFLTINDKEKLKSEVKKLELELDFCPLTRGSPIQQDILTPML